MTKRDKYLRKKYSITEVEYSEILEKQGGRCAICKKPKESFKRSLAVDHDHGTGKVRGLLCYYCNKRFVGRHTGESVKKLAGYLLPGCAIALKEKT